MPLKDNFLKKTKVLRHYRKSVDELFEEAVSFVLRNRIASATLLQRQLKVGYNRAARMIDVMELLGIVGPARGDKPRKVYNDIKINLAKMNKVKLEKAVALARTLRVAFPDLLRANLGIDDAEARILSKIVLKC